MRRDILNIRSSGGTTETTKVFKPKNAKEALWVGRLDTRLWVTHPLNGKASSNKAGGGGLPSVTMSNDEVHNSRTVDLRRSRQNVISWTTQILQHVKCGQSKKALRIFEEMVESGMKPNSYTFVAALKACGRLKDLEHAKQVHAKLANRGFESDLYVGTMLVDVYLKCGSLVDASRVFEKMPRRDVVSWTAMILGYAQMEKGELALELYAHMQQEGVLPNDRTFVSALKACSSLAAVEEVSEIGGMLVKQRCLEQVRAIHSQIVNTGCESDVYVGTMLVDVYVKCRSLVDARHVFEKMPCRDVICWTAMVLGYVHMGEGDVALHLYARMQQEGVVPDYRALTGALQACSNLVAKEDRNTVYGILVKKQCLEQVKAIHTDIVQGAYESDMLLGGMLTDVYVKCGSLTDARHVFERMPCHDVVSWNAMIWGFARAEEGQVALECYTKMQHECVVPNDRTFVGVLKACSSLVELEGGDKGGWECVKRRCLEQVRAIHVLVMQSGYDTDIFVATMMLDVYAKCGSLGDARRIFDEMPQRDVVSWNAMILGYVKMEDGEEALHLLARMRQEGVLADERTFVGALKACSCLATLKEGSSSDDKRLKKRCLEQVKAIHLHVVNRGPQLDVFVGTMLVDSYAKCGSLVDARHVFEKMNHRDVVSWTAMIMGYAHVEGEVALQLYKQMKQEGVLPNDRTYVGALKACGSVAGLEKGKEIHAEICKIGLDTTDSFVASSLIDMYGKCGSMGSAQQVFDAVLTKDIGTWNALIAGYARQGESETVFDLFDSMKREAIQPEAITFLSILSACCHGGIVEEGQKYFDSMSRDFSLTPTIEHYTCMVDLLGRAGQVDKAMAIAKTLRPDAVVWKTVLGACQKWSKVDLGREAFTYAVRLDREDSSPYVLMSNIYMAAHMWQEAEDIHAMKMKTRACKSPGQSWWSDSGGTVNAFLVGDTEHSESRHICVHLEDIFVKMEEERDTIHVD